MGRIERSIFTCDWLLDPELRRRSHGNLNKDESRHALVPAVFFHRLGELRDRVTLIPVPNENFSFGRGELQLAEGAPRW